MLGLVFLAALPLSGASAGVHAQVLDMRAACGIWGPFQPEPGRERAGVCVYDAKSVSDAGYVTTTWLWTWHNYADGRSITREDHNAHPTLDEGPLGDKAVLRGTVQGCAVELNLVTQEGDPTRRFVADPQYLADPAPAHVWLEGRQSMNSYATGTGKMCTDPFAKGVVTGGILFTGQWPAADVSREESARAGLGWALEQMQRVGAVRAPSR